jgi:hypothetical protein
MAALMMGILPRMHKGGRAVPPGYRQGAEAIEIGSKVLKEHHRGKWWLRGYARESRT